MTPFIKTTILILFGSFIGYFSAHYVISGNFGDLTTYNNGWTLWNKAGQPDADPYTKAHFALKRELPLSGFEEMIFSTNLDSTGGPLTSNCRYQIEGNVISSRSWGLSVVGQVRGPLQSRCHTKILQHRQCYSSRQRQFPSDSVGACATWKLVADSR